jgi:hypothetical protein
LIPSKEEVNQKFVKVDKNCPNWGALGSHLEFFWQEFRRGVIETSASFFILNFHQTAQDTPNRLKKGLKC